MGIFLLVLLILIFLILAALLFAPIRWEVGAKAAQQPLPSFRAFGKVRWLAGAVCLQMRATEHILAFRLKLFGRVIRQTAFHWRYPFAPEQGEEPGRQERKEPPEREAVREAPAESAESATKAVPQAAKPLEPEKIPERKKPPEPERSQDPGVAAKERDEGSAKASRSGRKSPESRDEKGESFFARAKSLWTAWHEPENARMLGLVKKQVSRVLRHLRPQIARVHAVVGLGDPAATGELLGVFYAFWPLFAGAGDFRLMGDFERKTLEGKLYLKGRIRNVVPVSAALRLFLDRGIRRLVISYFKN